MGAPRRSCGYAAAMIGSDTASRIAPPMPCRARTPISMGALVESAQPSEAAVNSTMPSR
ncbi:Uncharacterised protein [Mycobacteroides abscessus subsp. massiliense]|nr:Uncharacterised protein [Mycobacteroides abscessus subsp. massiliense]